MKAVGIFKYYSKHSAQAKPSGVLAAISIYSNREACKAKNIITQICFRHLLTLRVQESIKLLSPKTNH